MAGKNSQGTWERRPYKRNPQEPAIKVWHFTSASKIMLAEIKERFAGVPFEFFSKSGWTSETGAAQPPL